MLGRRGGAPCPPSVVNGAAAANDGSPLTSSHPQNGASLASGVGRVSTSISSRSDGYRRSTISKTARRDDAARKHSAAPEESSGRSGFPAAPRKRTSQTSRRL